MPRQLGAADGGRCGRALTLAGVVWGMLVSLAVAGPLEAYVAATDTTHLNWNELSLVPVDAITGPGDGHISVGASD